MVGPAPQDDGKTAFDLNSDEFIFWQKKAAGVSGRPEAAGEDRHGQGFRADVFADHRLDPGAHRYRPVGAPASATASARRRQAMAEAVKSNRVVLSLAHNMAQPNQITAAMIDVLTEYVHNNGITPRGRPEAPRRGRGQRPLTA